MTLNTKAMIFVAACARDVRARAENDAQIVPSPCMSVCQMDEALGFRDQAPQILAHRGNIERQFAGKIWDTEAAADIQQLHRTGCVFR